MAQAAAYPFQNVSTQRQKRSTATSRIPQVKTASRTSTANIADRRRYRYETNTPTAPTTDELFRNTQVQYNSVAQTRDQRLKRRAQDQVERTVRTVAENAPMPSALTSRIAPALSQGVALVETTRRASVLTPTIVPGLYAHAALLFFWFLSVIGLGLAVGATTATSWIPLVGDAIANATSAPGETIFLVGWAIAAIIGCLTLVLVLGVCLTRGIIVFKNAITMLVFIGAFALYLFPFTQFFPWYLAFGAWVTFFHK